MLVLFSGYAFLGGSVYTLDGIAERLVTLCHVCVTTCLSITCKDVMGGGPNGVSWIETSQNLN